MESVQTAAINANMSSEKKTTDGRIIPTSSDKALKYYPAEDESKAKKVREPMLGRA